MRVNKIILLLSVILLSSFIRISATEPNSIILIDGYFFYEIPIPKQDITQLHSLRSPYGTTALGLVIKTPLPEEALQHAVPKEEVADAEWLLFRYNEAKRTSSGIGITAFQEARLNVGDKFPPFTSIDIEGNRWTLYDVQGKIMVVNLWFTGCGPCRAEMPELSTWKNEMPDVIFFSSTYEPAPIARPVIEKQGFNWIHLVENTTFADFVGGKGYPMTIIVDKNGVISMIEYGTSPTQRLRLKKHLEQLRNSGVE